MKITDAALVPVEQTIQDDGIGITRQMAWRWVITTESTLDYTTYDEVTEGGVTRYVTRSGQQKRGATCTVPLVNSENIVFDTDGTTTIPIRNVEAGIRRMHAGITAMAVVGVWLQEDQTPGQTHGQVISDLKTIVVDGKDHRVHEMHGAYLDHLGTLHEHTIYLDTSYSRGPQYTCTVDIGGGKTMTMHSPGAKELATMIARFHDGVYHVGQVLKGAGTAWQASSVVVSYDDSQLVIVDDVYYYNAPTASGTITLTRTGTPLAGGTTGSFTVTIGVTVDLLGGTIWLDVGGKQHVVIAERFGEQLTGVIDAIATSADYEIDPASSGMGITAVSIYRLVAQEKGGSLTAPAVMFTFGTGGTGSYKSQSGDFLVDWKVDGHDAITIKAGSDGNIGRWTDPAMVEQVLPELAAVAAWLAAKDPAHELVVKNLVDPSGLHKGGTCVPDTAWVGFSITGLAADLELTKHFIAFDTAHAYGDGRAHAWYHPSRGKDNYEYKMMKIGLQEVLNLIRL